jgi:hypothetical protein
MLSNILQNAMQEVLSLSLTISLTMWSCFAKYSSIAKRNVTNRDNNKQVVICVLLHGVLLKRNGNEERRGRLLFDEEDTVRASLCMEHGL